MQIQAKLETSYEAIKDLMILSGIIYGLFGGATITAEYEGIEFPLLRSQELLFHICFRFVLISQDLLFQIWIILSPLSSTKT